MPLRVLASGTTLHNNGARIFSVAAHNQDPSIAVLTDITVGFRFSGQYHYHYEIDLPQSANVLRNPGNSGAYYVLCSTSPPNRGVWPNGYTKVSVYTDDIRTSVDRVGTMIKSEAEKTVYKAKDLLVWIPNTVLRRHDVECQRSTWTVDF
jgi:hypothetical protein